MRDIDKVDFDEEWEEVARETLEDVPFDTDLGVDMARDAEKMANGEMTQEEFNEKYHEQIVEEFGMDARPTIEGGPDRDPRPDEVKAAIDRSSNDYEETELTESEHVDEDTEAEIPDEWIADGVPEAVKEDVSRRSLLKSTAIATGAISVATLADRNPGGLWGEDGGGVASAQQPVKVTDPDSQMGMVIDTEACVGDLVCVDACERENKSPTGALWQFVFQYDDPEQDEANFLVRPCQHCSDPPCRDVCPVRARHKRQSDGIVLTDYDICIGCRYCMVGCPYGVNYFQWGEPGYGDRWDPEDVQGNTWEAGLSNQEWDKQDKRGRTVAGPPPEKGVMTKCTFCVHRQDSGDPELEDTTACEESCPQDAIRFGELTDPESDPRQYLREEVEERGDAAEEYDDRERVSTWRFKEDRGTSPNVIYIGNEPSEKAEWWDDEPSTARMQSYDGMNLQRRRPNFEGPAEEGGH